MGHARSPMAEHAGARSAAMAAPIHQLLAPTGCAWFFGPGDRKTHSQASSVPSKAQAKLLAEYHQTASTLTAERLEDCNSRQGHRRRARLPVDQTRQSRKAKQQRDEGCRRERRRRVGEPSDRELPGDPRDQLEDWRNVLVKRAERQLAQRHRLEVLDASHVVAEETGVRQTASVG